MRHALTSRAAACHPGGVRRSEFVLLAESVLGRRRAASVVDDLVLDALGDRTAAAAIEHGVDPGTAWVALCDALDVAPARRFAALDEQRRA